MIERVPFVMDELVDIQIGCQLRNGSNLYADYNWERTPLLNYLISSTVGSGLNSYYTALSARKVMWVVSVLIILLTFLIARQLVDNYYATIAIVNLTCYTTFLDRSFRVRSDLASTLLSLPALWVLIYPTSSLYPIGLAGLFLGVAFLFTQKATYFVAAFGIALIGKEIILNGLNRKCLREIIRKAGISSILFFIPILFFIAWLNITNQFDQFYENGIIHAAKAGFASNTYKESTKLFLRQTIFRNPAIWLLGIIGFIMCFLRGIHARGQKRTENINIFNHAAYFALALWMMALLVLIINHKVKFPYLFLNISPSIAICAAFPIYRIVKSLNSDERTLTYYLNFLILVLIIPCVFLPAIYRHRHNLKYNPIAKAQELIMNRVDNITNANDRVFDGIGIAVTRKKATPYSMTQRWFNERREGIDYNIIEDIKMNQPKIMILNYRIKKLKRNEREFLLDNFVKDWANVYVVAKKIKHIGPGETKAIFNLLTSTKYTILSEYKENVQIDGEDPETTVFLTSGKHEIKVVGKSQEILLKYSKAVATPLPSRKSWQLFQSYRD